DELPLRPGQAGLADLHREWRFLVLVAPDLELLEGLLDLLAARALPAALGRRGAGGRIRARDAGHALLGLRLAGQERIEKDPGDAAECDRGQAGESERLLVEAEQHVSGPVRRRRLPR